jgi:putative phosphoribosyl transferase
MLFRDRADGGKQLARALADYKDQNPVILALPRGGVEVAARVASALHAPLDIVLVRKIGAPAEPELAVGAVVDGREPIVVRNPDAMECTGTTEEEFRERCDSELKEIERRRALYCGRRPPVDLAGRVVILIDDGIATGATARAAIHSIRVRGPKKIVLAVPVASERALELLRSEVDDVVCLTDMGTCGAVGYLYQEFRQLTDKDVVNLLSCDTRERAA